MAKAALVAEYRRQIETLYTHRCTVRCSRSVKDPKKKTTSNQRVTLYDDLPCRVSFQGQSVQRSALIDTAESEVKLFVAPDIVIPEGSEVEVTMHGKTLCFICSTAPALYATHNEYTLSYQKAVL